MEIRHLSERNVVFTFTDHPNWILNLHLIKGEKHNFIIDTGFGAESLMPIFGEGGYDKPYIIVNTHFHWDHIWGNSAADNFPIIGHRLCPKLIDLNFDENYGRNKQYAKGLIQKVKPTLLFNDEIYFPDDNVRIFHSPGHTADSISVFDEAEGILNAGDNIGDTMDHIVPELDCEKPVFEETLVKYEKLNFTKCVNGHNDILGKEVIQNIMGKLYL